jgi:hypothetical protein
MPEPIIIDDAAYWRHTVAKWKAALPLHYQLGVQAVADYAEYQAGRRDLDFVVEANRRAVDTMVLLYDLCANDDERKLIRNCFREIMAQPKGRLAPYYPQLHASIRTRLREHKMYARCGLDPPDEPRGRRAHGAT